jgi:acyl carrier protein
METSEIRSKLLALLTAIAPDVEPGSVNPDQDLRDQFDFDSMDTLHFATAISETFAIDVPQTDYARLASLRTAGEFVQAKLAGLRGKVAAP